MRPAYGTVNSTASSVAIGLYTSDTNSRMFSVSLKARTSNVGNIYIGSDTAVLSTAGYELTPGDEWSISAGTVVQEGIPATVRAHLWNMSAPSTTDLLDWAMLLET